jgi:hypothetical protein
MVMTTHWDDLTPEQQRDHLERISRALEGHEENKAALAERRAYNALMRAMDKRRAPAAPTVTKEVEVEYQRPAPRDWVAERRWVESIIDSHLAHLPESIGQAVAEINAELRKSYRAELLLARRDIAEELRREYSAKIEDLRVQFARALAGDASALERRLQRLDAAIDRWTRLEAATRDLHTINVRPN